MPHAAARALRAVRDPVAEPDEASAARWSIRESKMALALGLASLLGFLVTFVWLLATLSANVAGLRNDVLPGIRDSLVNIDGRLQKLEERRP